MKSIISTFIFLITFIITIHATQPQKREMRAAWIATVANIDWPSQPGLVSEKQRAEMITLLDELAKNNINAIVLQIRPTSDAFYPSALEPWSHWLTGKQGVQPNEFYDPLAFITQEAHKRFMQVHVWLNPYRVTNGDGIDLLSKDHKYYKNQQLFVKYGGKYYFNPGYDETRQFLNNVVGDIVTRYDIDAIHFDDYFYPYRVENEEFPDDSTFIKYPRGFAPNQKNDWRRNNVNMVIGELQQTIKSIKPWVEFGISPFGVWRNKSVDPIRGSDTRAGVQNYDDLYADILKWLQEGTIDYVVPQLYWEIGKKAADYSVLVKWWSDNSFGKNLYIGLYASQLGSTDANGAWRTGNELTRQLTLNEKYPQVDGVMYFSASKFIKNKQGLNDSLQNKYYKYPAICPINRNIQGGRSTQPKNMRIVEDGENDYLVWANSHEKGGYAVAYYVIYAFDGKKEMGDFNNPANIVARTTENHINLHEIDKKFKKSYSIVVTAINHYNYESIPTQSVSRTH